MAKRTPCVGDTVIMRSGLQAKVSKVNSRVHVVLEGNEVPFVYKLSNVLWNEHKQHFQVV